LHALFRSEQAAALITPDIDARTTAADLRLANARTVGTDGMTGHVRVFGDVASGDTASATSLAQTSARGLRPDVLVDATQGRDGKMLTRQSDTLRAKEAKAFAPDARPLAGQAFEQLFSSTLAGGQGGTLAGASPGDALAGLNPVSALAPSITGVTSGLAAPAAIFTGGIPVPVGSPQWVPAFSEQMVQIGTQQGGTIQHAELRLDPPDLGPLRISISMQGEQATATFVSPHASVRAAVEAALPELMQALADAGISLGDTSVSEQDAREFAAEGSRHGAARDGSETGDEQDLVQAVVQSRPRGLVDTFA
nr:flagellar hook-length control protein FliK [Pseudomonas sp.]